MKKIFRHQVLLLVLALLVIALASCSIFGGSSSDRAKYTLIVYGNCGDEKDQIIELGLWEKLKPVLQSDDVRVIVFYKYLSDDAHEFTGKYANKGDVVFFELTKNTDLYKIREDSLEHWPDYRLDNPEYISKVVKIAKSVAPAKNYIFVTWGHGGGFDYSFDYPEKYRQKALLYDYAENAAHMEAMSAEEFSQALAATNTHFKAIFFHDCYMGNMESLHPMIPYADYIISSMHVLRSSGDPIIGLVKGLYSNSDFEKAAAYGFDDMYDEWFKSYTNANGDLKVLKTSELNQFEDIFSRLAKRLVKLYPSKKTEIDSAMDEVYWGSDDRAFVDARDYVNKLEAKTGDSEIKKIAKDMRSALDDAIIIEKNISNLDDQSAPKLDRYSLSVVLCDKATMERNSSWLYPIGDAYEYSSFHKKTGWGNWLRKNTNPMPFEW